jgi:putative peptidoglycan lipid II flippase
MFRKIVKNTTILSSGTFSSRILGFIRDVLIAKYFGTSAILEAFIVAFRIPNLLRSLFGEGFSDSVATPVFSEHSADKKRVFQLGNRLILVFLVIISLIVVLGVLSSRYLVVMIAPGFAAEPFKLNLAASFTRITFFYLLLISLTTILNSLLYSVKRFLAPAFSPCLLNISFIVAILFFRIYFDNFILVIALLSAGVLQLLFSYFFIRREGFRFKFTLKIKEVLADSQLIRMFRLFLPRLASAAVYHLNVFIDTIFSSLSWIVGQGGLAAIYYGNRIIQFPLALIALSVSRVALVDFSRLHKQKRLEEFKKLFVFSFENIMFFIVPVTFILLFIPQDIIRILFFRGEFDFNSLIITKSVLFFYAFGLLFFCGIKLLVNAFYAIKDTLTPAKVAGCSLLLNVAFNAVFMFPLKIGGIALASSLAAFFNFIVLYHILIKRLGKINWGPVRKEILKLVTVSLSLGAISRFFMEHTLVDNQYINFLSVLLIDFFLFCLLGTVLKLKQFRAIYRWIKS